MLRDVLPSVVVLLFVAGQSSAGVITFSTLHNDITVGSPVIPGHGLPKDSAYPVFTWTVLLVGLALIAVKMLPGGLRGRT